MIDDSRVLPSHPHEIPHEPTGSGLMLPRSIKPGASAHTWGVKTTPGIPNHIKHVQGGRAPI